MPKRGAVIDPVQNSEVMMDDFQVADDLFMSIADVGFGDTTEETDSLLLQNLDSIPPSSSLRLRASGSSPASYPGTEKTEVPSTPELSRSCSNIDSLSNPSPLSSEKGCSNDDKKNFPAFLHDVVSDEKFDSIFWLSCGTRFVISDREKFSKTVLNQFGGRGQAKFTSFTRRLKRWDFRRVPSGREMGAYFREGFQRDRPEAANKIKYPISVKGKNKGKGKIAATTKAQRRASTGSFVLNKPQTFDIAEGRFFDISPTPIKNPLMVDGEADSLPLPVLENWLSSTDLLDEKKAIVSAAPSSLPTQHRKQPILIHPKAIRRHSIALYNLSMQRAPSLPDETISAGPPQLATVHDTTSIDIKNAKSTRQPQQFESVEMPQPQQFMSMELSQPSIEMSQPQQFMSIEMPQQTMQLKEGENSPFGFK